MVIRLSHMPGEEPEARRQNKFRAKRSTCGQGHKHASGAEARRCDELSMLQRGGHIRNLEQQPKFFFTLDGRRVVQDDGRPVRYTADFRYDEARRDGAWHDVVEDVKGRYRDDTWTLRRAFFRFFHPEIELREVK